MATRQHEQRLSDIVTVPMLRSDADSCRPNAIHTLLVLMKEVQRGMD